MTNSMCGATSPRIASTSTTPSPSGWRGCGNQDQYQTHRKEDSMELSQLSDAEVAVTARALSIHRVSVRRKLERLRPGTPEHRQALVEMTETTSAIEKFNAADLSRASVA